MKISAHLPCQTLTVLLEQLTRDEGEVIELGFLCLFSLLLSFQFVVKLLLVVEKEEFVLEDV